MFDTVPAGFHSLLRGKQMTMGLKIHRMMREDIKDHPEIVEEAEKRKEMSDSILEIIYNRIMNKKDTKSQDITEENE